MKNPIVDKQKWPAAFKQVPSRLAAQTKLLLDRLDQTTTSRTLQTDCQQSNRTNHVGNHVLL